MNNLETLNDAPSTLKLRLPKSVYLLLATVAKAEGTSMNQLCLSMISSGLANSQQLIQPFIGRKRLDAILYQILRDFPDNSIESKVEMAQQVQSLRKQIFDLKPHIAPMLASITGKQNISPLELESFENALPLFIQEYKGKVCSIRLKVPTLKLIARASKTADLFTSKDAQLLLPKYIKGKDFEFNLNRGYEIFDDITSAEITKNAGLCSEIWLFHPDFLTEDGVNTIFKNAEQNDLSKKFHLNLEPTYVYLPLYYA